MSKFLFIVFAIIGALYFFTKVVPVRVMSQTAFVIPTTHVAISWGLIGLSALVLFLCARVSVK